MAKVNNYQTGARERLNRLTGNDGIFIRLQLGQLLIRKRLILGHDLIIGWLGNCFAGTRSFLPVKDAPQRREDTSLGLSLQESRVVLEVKRKNHLPGKRRTLQKR